MSNICMLFFFSPLICFILLELVNLVEIIVVIPLSNTLTNLYFCLWNVSGSILDTESLQFLNK